MSPAKLGATSKGPVVQIFGIGDSQGTRAATRFFRERRIVPHLVDLRHKPIAPAELRRFVERLGARGCADTDGAAWKDAGLDYLVMDDAALTARLLADVRLLKLPFIRIGNGVAAGRDESAWKALLPAKK